MICFELRVGSGMLLDLLLVKLCTGNMVCFMKDDYKSKSQPAVSLILRWGWLAFEWTELNDSVKKIYFQVLNLVSWCGSFSIWTCT